MVNCDGRFAWYELITTDMDTARTFYQDVMGWGVLDASLPNRAYTLFTAGSTLVGGLLGLTSESAEKGARGRFAFHRLTTTLVWSKSCRFSLASH